MTTLTSGATELRFDERCGALISFTADYGAWPIMSDPGLGASFRLLVPTAEQRCRYVDGRDQPAPRVNRGVDRVDFIWDFLRMTNGDRLPVSIRTRITLVGTRAVFEIHLSNDSECLVENVHFPIIGECASYQGSALTAIAHAPGGASSTPLWPVFPNAYGFCSVDRPTFATVRANLLGAVGAPVTPFVLLQSEDHGLYWGVDEPSAELVVWHGELHPGWGDSIGSRVPVQQDLAGTPPHISFGAVHLPFLQPGERRRLTPVALEPYRGDWHAGADVYADRRAQWQIPPASPPPAWVREPHSWQQIQLNSAEDSLRVHFSELPAVARECADRGVTALQVVGWNDGGQDRNNPSHRPDPRLGGESELKKAIAACRALGVKVVLFTKFVWADRSTARFRDELQSMAIKDPYGDYYVFPGFRYDTVTQLLDINTRRLIPMCFDDERWIGVCQEEFARVVALGADGVLHDEALHHSPALLCFDAGHGHRVAAPVYGNDLSFVNRLRQAQPDQDGEYLYAAEACYDWLFDAYELSYQRSNDPAHVPLSRYLRPQAPILTAVTGYEDRSMVNQCLLYRYLMSYEPALFKGRLTEFEETIAYGRRMDRLRTELREWFWDGQFRDTCGGSVTRSDGEEHHPFAVFESLVDGSPAMAVANYESEAVHLRVTLPTEASHRYRLVDDETWSPLSTVLTVPGRSAAVIVPDRTIT